MNKNSGDITHSHKLLFGLIQYLGLDYRGRNLLFQQLACGQVMANNYLPGKFLTCPKQIGTVKFDVILKTCVRTSNLHNIIIEENPILYANFKSD